MESIEIASHTEGSVRYIIQTSAIFVDVLLLVEETHGKKRILTHLDQKTSAWLMRELPHALKAVFPN